jgi:hypothetical protein
MESAQSQNDPPPDLIAKQVAIAKRLGSSFPIDLTKMNDRWILRVCGPPLTNDEQEDIRKQLSPFEVTFTRLDGPIHAY